MKNKIKGILGLHGYSFADYARKLDITPQALQSKFSKQTYRVKDFIALAELTDTELALVDKEGNPVMKFDMKDLTKPTK